MKYTAKDTKSKSAALLALQLMHGKAAEHMLESGINQASVNLYAAKLAFAYQAKEKKDATPAGLAALFEVAGIANASALRQAGESIVAIDEAGKESAALPSNGKTALAPSAYADL